MKSCYVQLNQVAMNAKKKFNIVILEDSEFYNQLLTRQLENYTDALALDHNCKFEIQSYTRANDCLKNLRPDTHVAFVDFHLGSVTALDLIGEIKNKCYGCKIIVMSLQRNIKTAFETINEGAAEFIHKDVYAMARSCFIIEDLVEESLKKAS